MTHPAAPLILPAGLNVGEAFTRILQHHGAILLHHANRIPAGGEDAEPVHQTRVALRRLRSALAVFRGATQTPAVTALAQDLRAFGHSLGPARAWDVFLAENGARIGRVFAEDTMVTALLREAGRKRDAAYAALAQDQGGPRFSALAEHLTSIAEHHGWRDTLQPDQRALLAAPLDQFGADILARLHRRVRRAGRHVARLDPPALHALRLRGKRLRYAAEFFASQYDAKPASRYIRRLAAVQERLGGLNDAATTTLLLAELRARGRAGGIVIGYTTAEAENGLHDLARVWKRFRNAAPFWVAEGKTENSEAS